MEKSVSVEATGKSRRKTRGGFIQKGKMDIGFFALVSILLTCGLLMLFSASYAYALAYFNNSYHFIVRQLVFAVIGFVFMLAASRINCHVYRRFAWVIYGISVALLILLLALPPMLPSTEQKRWLVIGSFSFQPSEIAKFSIILLFLLIMVITVKNIILLFSHLIAKNYKKMKTFKYGVLTLGALLGVVCGLVVVETHLSATILIFLIGITLMIIGGIKAIYILVGAGVGIGGAAIAIFSGVVGYASDRLTYWFNPWADATGKGYQTIQSLLAIGSGGVMGRGFGESRQKYLWVPEPHNDFIFSIVCEELGLIGAVAIILLFCALVWRGFYIAMKAPDKFSALMAALPFRLGCRPF